MTSPTPPEEATVWRITGVLQAFRLDLTDEKRLQANIEGAFASEGIAFQREYRLTAADVVDFLVEGGIAVECKLKGKGQRKAAIFRQLRRYATSEKVNVIVLATNVAMGLPPEIKGKPAYYVSLSTSWL